uniref:2-phosphoxylose phosphatase 1 n=1 Tax=Mesocestoides corti TaxID=53468 RepID=A0A5K3F5J6_MESCO
PCRYSPIGSRRLLIIYEVSTFRVRKGIASLSKINLKLVQVQVFFRHGARTPLHYIKSSLADCVWTPDSTKDAPETVIPIEHVDIFDQTPVDEDTVDLTYKPYKLPGGESIGMLTTVGQKELYQLGIRLRKEYAGADNLISDPVNLAEIQVRSTRVGRNIKSLRSLIAGMTEGHVEKPLVIPTMRFEEDVLFPNTQTCPWLKKMFIEGTEELKTCPGLSTLKKKLREALRVDHLIDELEDEEGKESRDCQVYYVRDDYIARKHNNFPLPPTLSALDPEVDHFSAVELLSELLGARRNWTANLDVNIGPVLHIILSKIRAYADIPPLQLMAVHDSTLLPLLCALDCCDEIWPPFGADIIFEIYSQTSGSSVSEFLGPVKDTNFTSNDNIDSKIDWTTDILDNLWVRVRYLGKGQPLASLWNLPESVHRMTGSNEFIPLRYVVQKLTPFALSLTDYRIKCQSLMDDAEPAGKIHGAKNL